MPCKLRFFQPCIYTVNHQNCQETPCWWSWYYLRIMYFLWWPFLGWAIHRNNVTYVQIKRSQWFHSESTTVYL